MFLSQNIFQQGPSAKAISLNSFYTILFRNGRDASQLSCLGKQIYPGRAQMLTEAYLDVTSVPYTYLVLDTAPHSNPDYKMRTNIFPGEDPIIYLPRKSI